MTDSDPYLEALKQVIDPELMINIVDLGLVYSVNCDDENKKVFVEMTLTSPACPAGPQIINQSKMALEQMDDVDEASITLVMSPPWSPERMTDDARDQLGIF
jgi:metal-sulfur cluster biosynthetic enzyme